MSGFGYYKDGEKVRGPFSTSDLKRLASKGTITVATLVRRGGDGEWIEAGLINGFFSPMELQKQDAANATEENPFAWIQSADEVPPVESNEQEPVPTNLWYAYVENTKVGPLAFAAIEAMVKKGELGADDGLLQEGMPDWVRASSIVGLFPKPAPQVAIPIARVVGNLQPALVAKPVPIAAVTTNAGQTTTAVPNSSNDDERQPGRVPPAHSSRLLTQLFCFALITAVATVITLIGPRKPGDISNHLSREQLIATVESAIVRLDVEIPSGNAFGSGFVIDESGIIATNYHVIDGATSAKALFADDVSLPVTGVLATDPKRDIAILRIQMPKMKKLAILKLRQTHPKKGQSVFAFGSPQGLDFSVTQGMVSAIRAPDEKIIMDMELKGAWIQTDTAISKGNSGGPLVDLSGQVVGMNTFGLVKGDNLNFAISSTDIRLVFDDAKDAKPLPLKEPPTSTKLLASQLVGTWDSSPTGEVYLIGQHQDGLTIYVLTSSTLHQGRGYLTLSDDRQSWTGSFSATFIRDKSRQERGFQIELNIVNADTLDLIGDWVTWDGKGREISRKRAATVLKRKK